MQTRTEKIRQAAKRVLAEGKADLVIGFREGTVPLKTAPHFARTEAECDLLVWNSHCRLNLANFLPRRKDRVAVVAKGCDARNIVNHIVEKQIEQEQVYIIGVPCEGMVEPALIAEKEGRTVESASETDGRIILKGKDFTTEVDRAEVLRQNCLTCAHRNPSVHDELVVDPVPELEGVDRYADLKDLLARSDGERYEYYTSLVQTCIRCYACRDACPLCYCHVCFVDETMPQWVGKSVDPADVMTYHILRAFHCAGRCTDCGACEAACPMDIKVRQFTRLLEKDVKELYNYETGLSPTDQPPLTVYRPNDPQEFIK
ncbi:MAG: 4Fe-4S dicluster domain-containing protein [Proteobacteria bacterium]|nr:4Fe-4S dicluster domain-containing protein [Pseudomonadota bacterium]